MKKISLTTFILLFAVISIAQKSVTITGTLKNHPDEKILLTRDAAKGYLSPVDHAYFESDGSFTFTLDDPEGGLYILQCNEVNVGYLFLHNTKKVKWSADFKNIFNTTVIDGSEMSAYLLHLINTTSKYAARSDSVKRRFSPAKNREMEAAQKVISDEYKNFLRKEIRANPSSPALISFVDNLDTFEDSEYYKLLDDGTYRAFKGDPLVERFHNKVTRYVRTGVGTFAPEIDLPSFKGGNVKLSSLKNKVVLVDFWAVNAQNTAGYAPHLVRIYKRFANKGFEIYAVSLFGKVENLSAGSAVKAYTEVGIHVKAPQGWETEILGTYGVNSIRSTVLIDRDGRILARDISYEELEKWLEKLLP